MNKRKKLIQKMIFDALGGLPLGGIPDAVAAPTPSPTPAEGGAGSVGGGGSFFEESMWYHARRKEPLAPEIAILLAAYVQYYR